MIAPLLLAAAASAARFAPPLDRPLRVLLHQERVQAGITRRFEIERRLVFHRDGAGVVAEMTLVRVWQDMGGDAGKRFEAATGALKGRTMRLHLSADGNVTAIDDEAALWAATLAGIDGIASTNKGAAPAAALARDPGAALAALPPDRRRSILASPLTAVIAGADEDRTPGTGPITVAGNPVAGRSLTGTRQVAMATDARLHVTLHAAAADPAEPASLDRERTIDPATGLIVDIRETQSMGAGVAAQITRQHVTIAPW